jgi:hypothetical protein
MSFCVSRRTYQRTTDGTDGTQNATPPHTFWFSALRSRFSIFWVQSARANRELSALMFWNTAPGMYFKRSSRSAE